MFVPSKKSRFQVFTTQIFIDFDPVVDSKLRGIGANSRVHLHNLPSASWYGFDGFSYHRSLQAQKYKSINEFHGWCSVTALTIGLWDKTIGQTWTKQWVKVWVRGPLVLATNKRTRETRAFLQNVRERREPCLEIGAHALPVVVWHYRSAERKRAPVDMMRSGRAPTSRVDFSCVYARRENCVSRWSLLKCTLVKKYRGVLVPVDESLGNRFLHPSVFRSDILSAESQEVKTANKEFFRIV